ncbi:hypothetical protein VP01_76g5 [Puccinia sorghi]|uniref:Uncharacterized protein n=1 Tax=Puccinia sorghi TaxID=27349 RepID=A0A0L6UCE8_9BASI|nr:hypothetical protein VP01_76g5 [Puccinia sorghi]
MDQGSGGLRSKADGRGGSIRVVLQGMGIGQGTQLKREQGGRGGTFCIYLSSYQLKEPRKAEQKEKNWDSSFRITKRQNIHSLFPGCSLQRAVTRESLLSGIDKDTHQSRSVLEWNQRVLDTHWRGTLSYLLSRFFFPHIGGPIRNSSSSFIVRQLQVRTIFFLLLPSSSFLKKKKKKWWNLGWFPLQREKRDVLSQTSIWSTLWRRFRGGWTNSLIEGRELTEFVSFEDTHQSRSFAHYLLRWFFFPHRQAGTGKKAAGLKWAKTRRVGQLVCICVAPAQFIENRTIFTAELFDYECDDSGSCHCNKTSLSLQLTCRKSQEASVVTPTFSMSDSTKFGCTVTILDDSLAEACLILGMANKLFKTREIVILRLFMNGKNIMSSQVKLQYIREKAGVDLIIKINFKKEKTLMTILNMDFMIYLLSEKDQYLNRNYFPTKIIECQESLQGLQLYIVATQGKIYLLKLGKFCGEQNSPETRRYFPEIERISQAKLPKSISGVISVSLI